MKKIFTYMTLVAAVILTACSDDDIAKSSSVTDSLDKYAVTGTMASVAEFEEGAGDNDALGSKSQLYYDRVNKKMKFTWVKSTDHIGIYAKANPETQMDYKLDPDQDLNVHESSVTGVFVRNDGGASTITGGALYYSYFPYKEESLETGEFTYENIPISYRGQVQATNEQMNRYWQAGGDNLNKFLESEKAAAAHLGDYTYLISDATATAGNHVHFNYSYVGSIVRFYMVCPSHASDNIYYDSLQVYNSLADFTLDATMNLATKVVTPTKTSHVMSLGFHPAIDMTNDSEDSKDTYHYWDEDSSDPKTGYIMAYMMVSPVDLSILDEKSTLYLIGRKPSYYTWEEYNTAKGYESGDPGYIATVEAYDALPKIQKMKIYETMEAYNAAVNPDVDAVTWDAMTNIDKMKDYERKVYKKSNMSKLNFLAGKHHQWAAADAGPDTPITFQEISIENWTSGSEFTNADGDGTADW